MERRSWPWKKKSSDKSQTAAEANGGSLSSMGGDTNDKESAKAVKYMQISEESYAHLTEIEEQAKTLNEKLFSALSVVTSKDDLAKQHARVAEDAVSGWEKAEAEASALKVQLEDVMLQKLTADEKSSHLDGALKECMKQVRNVKVEGEQKLQDVIFSKTKQWEKVKSDMDSNMVGLEQELLKASAENATLARALQERTSVLMKISDEKTQADAEIVVLKGNIQSCEKEISSLKYEIHVISKELEIRNEEKNMSLRSAEVANKQHLEDIKKMTKLENECQRLRVLVRKKLPGPAALAQMKHEVESLGRDYGETRTRRPSARSSTPRLNSTPDFAFESFQQCHKENEFLTARLIAMDEETKMLKEALSKRNSELEVSRSMFTKMATKLRSLEASIHNHRKSSSNPCVDIESSLNDSNPSLTSMSEDGFDEDRSCAQSAPSISELLLSKKEKHAGMAMKVDNTSHLDLMDDFLEMEKLTCLSSEQNGPSSITDGEINTSSIEVADVTSMCDSKRPGEIKEQNNLEIEVEGEAMGASNALSTSPMMNSKQAIGQELESAISHIHDIVSMLGKEATVGWELSPAYHQLSGKIQDFSNCVNRVLAQDVILDDFIVALSKVLCEVRYLSLNLLGKHSEGDNSSDFVDKATLLENKVAHHEPNAGKFPGDGSFVPCSVSNPEADGLMGPGFDVVSAVQKHAAGDSERSEPEKESVEIELAKCKDSLSQTKAQLVEMESRFEDLQTQLASSQKSNSLSETQLKCMAESYKLLEARAQELETQISHMCTKLDKLSNELVEERRAHQDDLTRYKDLQEKISCAEADMDIKTKQEREIAAATEKLAECQETIFFLSKQLNAMRNPLDVSERSSEGNRPSGADDEQLVLPSFGDNTQMVAGEPMPAGADSSCITSSFDDVESSALFPPMSPTGSKPRRQRSVSSSSPAPPPPTAADKHGRGISRFFSSRSKMVEH